MTRTRSLSSIFSNNGHNQIVNRPYCSQFVSIRFLPNRVYLSICFQEENKLIEIASGAQHGGIRRGTGTAHPSRDGKFIPPGNVACWWYSINVSTVPRYRSTAARNAVRAKPNRLANPYDMSASESDELTNTERNKIPLYFESNKVSYALR